MAEYMSLVVQVPTLMKISGANGAVLKLPAPSMTNCWINEEEYFRLERFAQKEYNNSSNQQSGTVTANDLLKAIAIMKDASLATQLTKD